MARNLTPLMSAKDEQEFGIMPLRPSTPSTSPPLNQSAKSPLSNVFKPSGYEHLHLDDRDDIGSPQPDNGASSPQASTNSLGIYPDEKIRTSSVRRKPVEPKSPEITSASEAASPDSNCHLLDSPLSLDGRSARPPTWSGIRIPGIAEKLWSWSRTTLPGHRPTATSGQSGPTNNNSSSSLDPDTEIGDHGSDEEQFYRKYSEPPTACRSREDIGQDRNITMMLVSLYSTLVSGLWFFVACFQPQWGKTIRTGGGLEPSTATTLTTIGAKSIEISFVASFAWCAGQQLTRRAYSKRNGLTLAEICMRGWINKPGAWVVNWEAFWYGGRTVLTHRTMLMLLATLGATLYTPASDAMVSPKLKFSPWRKQVLEGPVYSSYANPGYVKLMCPAMFDTTTEALSQTESCINVQFSGKSYGNMMSFMKKWTDVYKNGVSKADSLPGRPVGTSLYGDIAMEGAWIETQHSNVTTASAKYGRIVNNVTLAMPHPGIYEAAIQEQNKILQPKELGGIGQYSIRAGVVSPAVNVLCVNVLAEEIAPLVYTTWPNSNTKDSDVFNQKVPKNETNWVNEVPSAMIGEEPYYYNRTELDDLFRWGPKYKRRPPIFSAYPNQYNFISSKEWQLWGPDAIYLLAKKPNIPHYTVCEARSWLTPACSTWLSVSSTTSWAMYAHCEDQNDENAYHRSFEKDQQWPQPNGDWKNLAEEWRKSLDLNGGLRNSNSSNGNILTKTILKDSVLPVHVPSLSEMLAVLLSSTTVLGSINAQLGHSWDYKTPGNILQVPVFQKFNASVRSEEYTSGHTLVWQAGVFYPVLGVVFVLNCLCIAYIWGHAHTLTDFTENENLFTLAINSPPSSQFNGSCGGGPKKRDFVVPWKVSYAEKENHYYFEAANERPWRGRYSKKGRYSAGDTPELAGDKYKRFSTSKVWI